MVQNRQVFKETRSKNEQNQNTRVSRYELISCSIIFDLQKMQDAGCYHKIVTIIMIINYWTIFCLSQIMSSKNLNFKKKKKTLLLSRSIPSSVLFSLHINTFLKCVSVWFEYDYNKIKKLSILQTSNSFQWNSTGKMMPNSRTIKMVWIICLFIWQYNCQSKYEGDVAELFTECNVFHINDQSQ